MPSARFLVVVVLFSSFALAQDQAAVPLIPVADGSLFAHPGSFAGTLLPLPLDSQKALLDPQTTVTPLEHFSNARQNSGSDEEVARHVEEVARYLVSRGLDPNSQQFTFRVSPQGKVFWGREDVCYSIRSYLMARDSKDSDATHLVSTSTCLPAQQYALKITDLKSHAAQP